MSRLSFTRRLAIGAAIVLAVVAVGANPAQAHTASTYYPVEWDNNVDVKYGLNTGFPGGEIRTRVWNAKETWNAATADPAPDFLWSLADDVNHGSAQSPCGISGLNTGAIFWNDLDYIGSGTLGATRICFSSVIWNFTIEFDNETSWYTGAGDAPANQWDFQSIATHEFGHAYGMTGGTGGHFPESDAICPENATRETMCPGYAQGIGTEHLRTLGTHDIHTFDAAY